MFDFDQLAKDEDGEWDEERNYIDGLMAEFAASPEAKAFQEQFGRLGYAAMMMEYGFNYINVSPATMTLDEFDEVIFELFPSKVSVEAHQAGQIIAELRAFWSFVAREYGSDDAKAILNTLDAKAAENLRRELSNSSNFGMAKSFVMMGQQSGFDMTTQEGIAAFQLIFNARLNAGQNSPPLLEGYRTDPGHRLIERPSSEAVKKKRKERKRQRVAKKRNRSR